MVSSKAKEEKRKKPTGEFPGKLVSEKRIYES